MRAISSVRLERSAHNADGNAMRSIEIGRSAIPISMRNRVARSSNLRWPTREERQSVRVPVTLPIHSGLVLSLFPSTHRRKNRLFSSKHEVKVPSSCFGHIAQLGQSAGLLTSGDETSDIPTGFPHASLSVKSSDGSKPDVVSSNLTMPVYGIGEQLLWQSKT